MEFCRPQKSWTAVVQGAVVCGIEKEANLSLKRTGACRNSYGICQDEIYSSADHSQDDAVQIAGSNFAQSQLDWLLSKGDLILFDRPTIKEKLLELRLVETRQDIIRVPIWRNLSSEEQRPTRYTDATDGQY